MMDKLKNIPHIRYLNLDERVDRRDYLENEFKKYGFILNNDLIKI